MSESTTRLYPPSEEMVRNAAWSGMEPTSPVHRGRADYEGNWGRLPRAPPLKTPFGKVLNEKARPSSSGSRMAA